MAVPPRAEPGDINVFLLREPASIEAHVGRAHDTVARLI
jgi:hypothetical protein